MSSGRHDARDTAAGLVDFTGLNHQIRDSSEMTVAKTKQSRARRAKGTATNPVSTGKMLSAVDPATGKVIGTVPVTIEQQIPAIVARARMAQRSEEHTSELQSL